MRSFVPVPVAALVLGLIAGAPAAAQESRPETQPTGPRISCKNPIVDFGEAGYGEPIEILHAFEIENAGTSTLEIEGVRFVGGAWGPSGVATAEKTTLAPAERTWIDVRRAALPRLGLLSPMGVEDRLSVSSNDPTTPHLSLTLRYLVVPPFQSQLEDLDFGTLPKGARPDAKSFDVLRKRPGRILGIKSDHPIVSATIGPIPAGEKRDGYRVSVTLADVPPVGEVRALISMQTDNPNQPTIAIPVVARVANELSVSPKTLAFGRVGNDSRATMTFDVQKSGPPDFAIEDVRVQPLGAFTTTVEELRPGQAYRITVTLPSDARPGVVSGTIRVLTSCPGETEVRAYCYALVSGP